MKKINNKTSESGLVGIIVLIVIALALLKYFLDWSVFEAASTPEGQETVGYTKQIINTIWSYLSVPLNFIWNKIIEPLVKFVWDAIISLLISSRNS